MVARGAAPGTIRNARKVLRLVFVTAEGSVRVPQALRPYLGLEVLKP